MVFEEDPDTGEIRLLEMYEPQGLTFSSTELKSVYLGAAVRQEEIRDEKAVDVFMQYAGETENHIYSESEQKQVFLADLASEIPDWAETKQVFSQEARPGAKPKIQGVSTGKKYKPVDKKVRPHLGDSPEHLRIERFEVGDPLEGAAPLPLDPGVWVPEGRYTQERRDDLHKKHQDMEMSDAERGILDWMVTKCNKAFAWEETERGSFRTDAFPPVKIATTAHTPWRLRNRPIPPGLHDKVCKMIKAKLDAGVYEPSNSSYSSRWFCVLKKDGESLRLVHALEPLNAVTIAHSGIPPATEDLAARFAGRAVGGTLDLYVGYDERLLDPKSRDLTTFQTPFGALRLVTLPMGWTNSVPIFHDDVTFILRPEMPGNVCVYIDDVGVGGPKTRYEDGKGGYEMMPGNSQVRRFMWEYFEILYRVLLRMQFYGGTFSGKKSVLVANEFTIVGHVCSYEGRRVNPERMKVILDWKVCHNVSDVKSFLGSVGTLRIFIKDFAKLAGPLNDLTKKEIPFEWGPEQVKSMQSIQAALKNAPVLKPIDHEKICALKLSVDTSYKAIGWYISVQDELGAWHYARFGSTLMNAREANYSQPKRELFGLMRALDENYYWLAGCRKLIVETDAKYIKGMLDKPGEMPNATVNRWVEHVRMYHFKLEHVAGKSFALADGLSRRPPQPDDEAKEPWDHSLEENDAPIAYSKVNKDDPDPLDFEEFKHDIDTRGGYAQEVLDLQCELQLVNLEVVPSEEWKIDESKREPYPENQRSAHAKREDSQIDCIREWLAPPHVRPAGMTRIEFENMVAKARSFYLHNGKLYRRKVNGKHQVVVRKEHRMYIMRAMHDALGHRGIYPTRENIVLRFWWPDVERDVSWYVTSCLACQERQKTLLRIPPVVTRTPPIFQVLHADVVQMSVPSNGCKYIVHGRCHTSQWMEGRPLRDQDGRSIGMWLFEEIITRWGCLLMIVTDNAGPFLRAIEWLKKKYGIVGITISAYNSQANGSIERPHFDVVNMLAKVCRGDLRKWYWYFAHIMWADRITIRKRFGVSPFYLVTAADPIVPLDIQEATWLTGQPTGLMSTEDLLVARAQALAKHKDFVEEIRGKIHEDKVKRVAKYELDHKATIKDYKFKPGDLVLVRNTSIESSLNRKLKPRYIGPMIVIHRNKGGAYIVAEMDGTIYGSTVGAFRLVPFYPRKSIELPSNIHDVIDRGPEALQELKKRAAGSNPLQDLAFDRMPKYAKKGETGDESDEESSS